MTVYFYCLKCCCAFRFIFILQQIKLPILIVLSILGPNLTDLTPSAERISVRVIDPFTIKPLDIKTIMDHTRATRGRILTVEDHYYEGGFHSLFLLYEPPTSRAARALSLARNLEGAEVACFHWSHS